MFINFTQINTKNKVIKEYTRKEKHLLSNMNNFCYDLSLSKNFGVCGDDRGACGEDIQSFDECFYKMLVQLLVVFL